jgi:hypothetical protein
VKNELSELYGVGTYLMLSTALIILSKSLEQSGSIIFRQECSLVWKVMHHPVRSNTNNNSHQTFKDKNPCLEEKKKEKKSAKRKKKE